MLLLLLRLRLGWGLGVVTLFLATLLCGLCCRLLFMADGLLAEAPSLFEALFHDATEDLDLACEPLDLLLELIHLSALLCQCACVGVAKGAKFKEKLFVFGEFGSEPREVRA